MHYWSVSLLFLSFYSVVEQQKVWQQSPLSLGYVALILLCSWLLVRNNRLAKQAATQARQLNRKLKQ
jgi:hypothetical protein